MTDDQLAACPRRASPLSVFEAHPAATPTARAATASARAVRGIDARATVPPDFRFVSHERRPRYGPDRTGAPAGRRHPIAGQGYVGGLWARGSDGTIIVTNITREPDRQADLPR